jgi:hypothetical protein
VATLDLTQVYPQKSDIFPGPGQGPTRVNVSAVLCYSEYSNGQWQPAKTSDATRPTFIGAFDAGGFDRSQIELGVIPASLYSPQADSKAIWVQITTDQTVSGTTYIAFAPPGPPDSDLGPPGFLLYNTYSAPVRGEDVNLPPDAAGPGEQRWFIVNPASSPAGTLEVAYSSPRWGETYSYEILASSISERIVQSQTGDFYDWSSAGGAWFAPFFINDSRHVFYVATSGTPPSVDFSLSTAPGHTGTLQANGMRAAIPPLIISPRAARPQPGSITHVIATAAAITYQGSVITSDGSAAAGRATADHEGA